MKKNIIFFLIIISLFAFNVWPLMAVPSWVRLKDVARILEVRPNQLMGFGLVVGLQNSGDTQQNGITAAALENLLARMGLPQGLENKTRNIASVLVTAELPAFAALGQKVDISVASLGDATSLKGGTLLQTPLMGADGKTYAVGQGPILLGVKDSVSRTTIKTAGAIPGGALVEKTVPVEFQKKKVLTISLHSADFTMAARVAVALSKAGLTGAKAIDAGTVEVPLFESDRNNLVRLIARVENLEVEPVGTDKVVINEKNGAIVIGQMVRLLPAIVSYGSITVMIGEDQTQITTEENPAKVMKLQPEPTLSSLADALRSLGATTSDLIAILEALQKSGALTAQLEIL